MWFSFAALVKVNWKKRQAAAVAAAARQGEYTCACGSHSQVCKTLSLLFFFLLALTVLVSTIKKLEQVNFSLVKVRIHAHIYIYKPSKQRTHDSLPVCTYHHVLPLSNLLLQAPLKPQKWRLHKLHKLSSQLTKGTRRISWKKYLGWSEELRFAPKIVKELGKLGALFTKE